MTTLPSNLAGDTEAVIAFLLKIAASPNTELAEQARADLLKWGFNPAEPRGAATGEWVRESSTSKTPERARRDQGAADAKDRAESAAELAAMNAEDRAAAEQARRHPPRHTTKPGASPVAEARRRYNIPTNIDTVGGKRGQAGRDLLAAAAELASIARRRETLNRQLAHLRGQAARTGLANATRASFGRRESAARHQLAELDRRETTAHTDLSDATRRWTRKASKQAATDVLVKGVRGPGQRYRHGWIPIVPDTLGLKDLNHPSVGVTYYASHEIPGIGEHPTRIAISSWDIGEDEDDAPRIDIATAKIWNIPGNPPEHPMGGYHLPHPPDDMQAMLAAYVASHTNASFIPGEARKVADHLRDLVAVGRSGHKAAPAPTPTRHSRTAQLIENFVDRGDIDLTDKVPVSHNGDELPITYRDLLALLAPHIPAPTPDAKRLRRTVKYGNRDEDNADVHMLLDTSGPAPVIHVGARESESFPWDPTGEGENADYDRANTSTLTLDAAAELADMLDHYADAVDKGATG